MYETSISVHALACARACERDRYNEGANMFAPIYRQLWIQNISVICPGIERATPWKYLTDTVAFPSITIRLISQRPMVNVGVCGDALSIEKARFWVVGLDSILYSIPGLAISGSHAENW